jgi:hypothetical protein
MSYKEERFLPTQNHKSDIHVAKIPVANPMTTIVGQTDKLHVKRTTDLMRETKKCTKIIWKTRAEEPTDTISTTHQSESRSTDTVIIHISPNLER